MHSKQLKIIGEVVLVCSFLTQTLLFDYYNDKSESLTQAYMGQAIIDKGSELKEIKFFVAKDPLDSASQKQYGKLNINMAAEKIALAKTMQIISLDTTKQARIDMCNELIQASRKVNDFNSYMNFIQFVNEQFVGEKPILDQITKIENRKTLFRWIFSSLYVIGSIILIFAILKEKE